jgi:WD40 repeat protein
MGIDELTFSPDGQYLASSGFHYAPVSIWCAKTGTHVASFTVEKPQKGPRGKFPLCFSPDGNLLAYVSSQNLLAISRIDNEHTTYFTISKLLAHSLSFSPCGRLYCRRHEILQNSCMGCSGKNTENGTD